LNKFYQKCWWALTGIFPCAVSSTCLVVWTQWTVVAFNKGQNKEWPLVHDGKGHHHINGTTTSHLAESCGHAECNYYKKDDPVWLLAEGRPLYQANLGEAQDCLEEEWMWLDGRVATIENKWIRSMLYCLSTKVTDYSHSGKYCMVFNV